MKRRAILASTLLSLVAASGASHARWEERTERVCSTQKVCKPVTQTQNQCGTQPVCTTRNVQRQVCQPQQQCFTYYQQQQVCAPQQICSRSGNRTYCSTTQRCATQNVPQQRCTNQNVCAIRVVPEQVCQQQTVCRQVTVRRDECQNVQSCQMVTKKVWNAAAAAQDKAEQERKAREAQVKAEQERKAREAQLKAEQERKAREAQLKAEQERKAREAQLKAEQERKAREAQLKAEEERKARDAKLKAEEERKRQANAGKIFNLPPGTQANVSVAPLSQLDRNAYKQNTQLYGQSDVYGSKTAPKSTLTQNLTCDATNYTMLDRYRWERNGQRGPEPKIDDRYVKGIEGGARRPGYMLAREEAKPATIVSELQAGRPVMLKGSGSQFGEHSVLVTGYSVRPDGALVLKVNDPGSQQRPVREIVVRSEADQLTFDHYTFNRMERINPAMW